MEAFILIYIILFGMILGSFLGMAVVRIPRGESIISPRSHCRGCDRALSWYENIPLFSYLALRGRCRKCGKKISIQYFLIELVTTLTVVITYFQIEPWPRFIMYLILFITPMLLLTFLDWEAMILPDFITLPGVIVGFLVHWIDGYYFKMPRLGLSTLELLRESLFGALAGFLTLLLLAWAYHKIRKRPGLGGGDVKLAAMLGAFFGWKAVFFIFFLASLAGTLFGVGLILSKKASKQTAIPFGTFLCTTAIVYLFYGEFLLKAYLNLFSF